LYFCIRGVVFLYLVTLKLSIFPDIFKSIKPTLVGPWWTLPISADRSEFNF
jgi:hypothetical protein